MKSNKRLSADKKQLKQVLNSVKASNFKVISVKPKIITRPLR